MLTATSVGCFCETTTTWLHLVQHPQHPHSNHSNAYPFPLYGMQVRSKPDAMSGQELPVAEGDTPLKRDCAELARRFCAGSDKAEGATLFFLSCSSSSQCTVTYYTILTCLSSSMHG